MKHFNMMDSVTKNEIGNATIIKVENIVYKKIQLIFEIGMCFYSEQERHLIRLVENKVYHSYCILVRVGQNKYRYSN